MVKQSFPQHSSLYHYLKAIIAAVFYTHPFYLLKGQPVIPRQDDNYCDMSSATIIFPLYELNVITLDNIKNVLTNDNYPA